MSMTFVLILAAGGSLKHGTQAECEAWYPGEPNAQLACLEMDPKSPQYAEMMRRLKLCKDIQVAASKVGIELETASYKAADGPATCNYTGLDIEVQ